MTGFFIEAKRLRAARIAEERLARWCKPLMVNVAQKR
jgi:hypothetical protein